MTAALPHTTGGSISEQLVEGALVRARRRRHPCPECGGHRLAHVRLEYGLQARRHGERGEAGAGACATASSEERRTRLAARARHDEHVAEMALVGVAGAAEEVDRPPAPRAATPAVRNLEERRGGMPMSTTARRPVCSTPG